MERIDDLQFDNLKIIQNPEWFCFGVDSVLLSEFARDIKKDSKIVDLGTGNGVLSILLSKKVNPSYILAIEKQKDVAEMAERSIKLNNLESLIEIKNEDIKNLKNFKNFSKFFDAVVTNPPYKKEGTGINAKNEKQQIARYESTVALDEWIEVSSKLLNDTGSLYIVYRTDRLTELIEIMRKYKLEAKKIRFVHSKINEQSNLVLIKAKKNAGTFLKIEPPLVVYNEDGTYTEEVLKIYKKR